MPPPLLWIGSEWAHEGVFAEFEKKVTLNELGWVREGECVRVSVCECVSGCECVRVSA